jgi:ribose transport system permease protein
MAPRRGRLRRWLSGYRMVLVLLALCAFFSYATVAEQRPTGTAAGERLADGIVQKFGTAARVLIVVRSSAADEAFAQALAGRLAGGGVRDMETIRGKPAEVRQKLERLADEGKSFDVIATNQTVAAWPVLEEPRQKYPGLGSVIVLTPPGYRYPNFLKSDNLLNIANQISVIAVLAVGMTMVIITGGIDLSVGSLIALAAVISTLLIRDTAGGEQASTVGMVLCCLAAVAVCGFIGLMSGGFVALLGVPPFLVTLGMMLMVSGAAFLLTHGQSVYQVPDTFVWLGRGADLGSLPNAVVLVVVLYVIAHVVMSRMRFGRYLYAVGGNAEAARLSGVPVNAVLMLAYVISGVLAGLGGVMMASQLKSGAPTYGQMYELYVIAAVVVGGTSLSGGEGTVFGTLIGALLIAVIQNGMNLLGVESYTQKVVLGGVILGAVVLDALKHGMVSFRSLFRMPRGIRSIPK